MTPYTNIDNAAIHHTIWKYATPITDMALNIFDTRKPFSKSERLITQTFLEIAKMLGAQHSTYDSDHCRKDGHHQSSEVAAVNELVRIGASEDRVSTRDPGCQRYRFNSFE
jgi:hypothetical protein